jgi:cytochrome c oxidase subunit 2
MFQTGGPAAGTIEQLWWVMIAVFSVVAIVVLSLLVVGALRRRGSLETHEPAGASGGQAWIYWGGLAVPVVILSALFLASINVNNRFPLHEESGDFRPDIKIVGRQWWWEVQYKGDGPSAQVVTANEIHLPLGWPVEVELESRDVIHSFWVPGIHGKVDLVPGRLNHVRLQADKPGVYEGQCAEFCGDQHAQMRIVVVAEPLEDFEKWLGRQGSPAVAELDSEATQGRTLFEERACGLCHTIRGTRALGSIGPDLTHLASRRGLAANSLPNQHAYLQAWAVRAQSLKPGAKMPDLDEFTGEELQSLTHYLQQLE